MLRKVKHNSSAWSVPAAQVEFAELSTSVDKERQDMMSQLEEAREKRGSETTQLAHELQASQNQVHSEAGVHQSKNIL